MKAYQRSFLIFIIFSLLAASVGYMPMRAYAADPATPTDLGGVAFQNFIEVSWDEPDSSFSYTVLEKSTNQGDFYPIATVFKGTTSYKDYTIMNGRVYTYRARTFYGSSPSAYTPEIEVIVYYPNFLKVNRSTSTEVDLEWTYPTLLLSRKPNHEVIIERRLHNTSTWSFIASLPSGETTYRDTTVDPDSLYYYRIRAYFSNGLYSNYIPSEWGLSTRTAYPLTTSFSGYAVSDTTILLEWDMTKANGGKAIIEKKDITGDFQFLYSAESGNAYADSRLTPGKTYTYRLKLQSKSGASSEYTEEISIVTETLPYPKDFEVTALADDRVALSWSYPYEVETGFEIWRKGEDSWDRLASLPKNTETFIDTSVSNGQTYHYKIRALRGSTAFSSFSLEKSVDHTKPSQPGALVFFAENNILHLYSAEEVPQKTVYTLEIREGLNTQWLDYSTFSTGTLVATVHYDQKSELSFRIRANRGNLYTYSPEFYFYGQAPDPVQNLTAEKAGFDCVTLSWADRGSRGMGYYVYRTVNGKRELIGQANNNAERFSDLSPIEGSLAQYEVSAYNVSGQSSARSVSVKVPKALQFKDINSCKWAHEAIYGLSAKGALDYQNGYFYPQATLSRGQMIRIILKSFDIPYASDGLFTLSDVTPSHPYYKDLVAAVNAGVIYPDAQGKIYPDAAVTRRDLIIALNNALNKKDIPLNAYSIENLESFGDYDEILKNEAHIMASFVGDGIITGKSGRLLGLWNKASRAEGVTIIYRTGITYLK